MRTESFEAPGSRGAGPTTRGGQLGVTLVATAILLLVGLALLVFGGG